MDFLFGQPDKEYEHVKLSPPKKVWSSSPKKHFTVESLTDSDSGEEPDYDENIIMDVDDNMAAESQCDKNLNQILSQAKKDWE